MESLTCHSVPDTPQCAPLHIPGFQLGIQLDFRDRGTSPVREKFPPLQGWGGGCPPGSEVMVAQGPQSLLLWELLPGL